MACCILQKTIDMYLAVKSHRCQARSAVHDSAIGYNSRALWLNVAAHLNTLLQPDWAHNLHKGCTMMSLLAQFHVSNAQIG